MILDPYVLATSAIVLSVVLLYRRNAILNGKVRLFLAIGITSLLFISLPCVSFLASASLEWQITFRDIARQDADAIVVLSGYIRETTSEYDPQLGDDTLRRCLVGMSVYRKIGPCPIFVSGGKVDPSSTVPNLADEMSSFLIANGVRKLDIVTETASRTTSENATNSAKLLTERGIRRVFLVTDAVHMLRSEKCFAAHGIEVVPIACNQRADRINFSIASIVPSSHAVRDISAVMHEWLGLLWYRMSGKI